jgi:opacity protein-like surface antigen
MAINLIYIELIKLYRKQLYSDTTQDICKFAMKKQHNLFPLLLLLPLFSFAQSFELGGIFGITGYMGDVNEKLYFPIQRDRTVAGGFLRYRAMDAFNVRLNMYRGSIAGSDLDFTNTTWRKERGYSFVSPIKEYSITAEYDVFKLLPNSDDIPLSLYLQAGVGYTIINPKTNFNEANNLSEKVNVDKMADFNRNILVLPIGATFELHFSKTFSLGIEAGMRKTFTDYIDGVSLLGNPALKDWYFVGGISLTQKLNLPIREKKSYHVSRRRVKCPSF